MISAGTSHTEPWPKQPKLQKSRMGERDQAWLERELETIWNKYFNDVNRAHPIKIVFGRPAKTRLGSIRFNQRGRHALVRINGLFRDPAIPAMIVRATIVHELCHYAHGFHSGRPQLHRYPHAGGVVRHEFAERGLGKLHREQKKWLKANWPKIVKQYF